MQNGRVYTVSFAGISLAAIQDLFELTPADDKPIEIIGIELAQTGVADVGDAQEEFLRLEIIRGFTTSGSGGSAPTPSPIKRSAAAAGFAAEVNNTTVATTGTGVVLFETAWNVRAGYLNWFPEGCEPEASQANTTMVVRMTAAPNDAVTVSGTLWVREGG